jgi:regulator of sigma E protease
MIPFGGYVRMLDDRDPDQETRRTPGSVAMMDLHPRWRVAIALGGPVANFLLAFVVFWILLIAGSYHQMPVLDVPAADSPVAQAGLEVPARVLSVDGIAVEGWQDVNLALADRLGETGSIELGVQELPTARERTLRLPITEWHAGVGEPDVFGSLGLQPALPALVGEVVEGAPAERAGLMTGDWIVAADGEPIADWYALVEQIESHAATAMTLTLHRNGTQLDVVVTPDAVDEAGERIGRLGIGAAQNYVRKGALAAIPAGLAETWNKSVMVVSVVKKMIMGQVSVKNLSGPITIAQVAGQSARYGWRQFLGILAFLSISLGVLNLLPIPILDGGHVVFNSFEWLTGKPVSERVQVLGVQIGLLLVGGMFVLATYNDVLRLF